MTVVLPRTAPGERPVAPWAGIAAFGTVQTGLEDMPLLRKKPGPEGCKSIPSSLLRHADEQTVTGVAAVLRAMHAVGWQERSFRDWGVLAAPRFLGRCAIAAAVSEYTRTGARGVSPLLIPHLSLHALAATISLALGMHGPNFGVGGGPGNVAEGLLTALSVLQEDGLPGVWLVLTAWNPEPCPDTAGQCTNAAACQAVALALVPARPAWAGLRLSLAPAGPAPAGAEQLAGLVEFLTRAEHAPGPAWHCPLGWRDAGQLLISA